MRMLKARKDELLKLIDLEIGKAKLSTDKTSSDVKNFPKFSPSQSGDAYHSENAAELAEQFLANLSELRNEVTRSSDELCTQVTPVAYVEIGFDTGERAKFYLVKKGALLPGILLITPNSPIGKAVEGKHIGDNFSYKIEKGEETITYSGKIDKIE